MRIIGCAVELLNFAPQNRGPPAPFSGQTVIEFNDLVDGEPIFKVFENGGNRHPRSTEHPRSAHFSRHTLHRRTTCPIQFHSCVPHFYSNPNSVRRMTILPSPPSPTRSPNG